MAPALPSDLPSLSPLLVLLNRLLVFSVQWFLALSNLFADGLSLALMTIIIKLRNCFNTAIIVCLCNYHTISSLWFLNLVVLIALYCISGFCNGSWCVLYLVIASYRCSHVLSVFYPFVYFRFLPFVFPCAFIACHNVPYFLLVIVVTVRYLLLLLSLIVI